MKILFVIRALEYYPYFNSIVDALVARGHKVEVLFDKVCSAENSNYIAHLKNKKANYKWAPYSRAKWRKIIFYFRDLLSFRRYYKVSGQSSYYKDRSIRNSPIFIRVFLYIPIIKAFILSRFFPKIMKIIELLMPKDKQIVAKIKNFNPDILLASPCNFAFASCEVEYLKTAKLLGIPTILPVFGWDNLTTKGLISIKPDFLFVWNEEQVLEAKKHHGIEENQTRITGSPFFDVWFSSIKPSLTKEEFCKKLKLNPQKPIILHLGSSYSISELTKGEANLVKKLRRTLDTSKNKLLKDIQIIVRPHPDNTQRYKSLESKNLKIYPQESSLPLNKRSIEIFINSIYHSDLIMGINTSAMLEAIVLNKPIVSATLPEYSKTQVQAQHFQQLIKSKVIAQAKTKEEFLKEIKLILEGHDKYINKRQEFVQWFIRPRGLKIAAGEVAAEEIEKIAQKTVRHD